MLEMKIRSWEKMADDRHQNLVRQRVAAYMLHPGAAEVEARDRVIAADESTYMWPLLMHRVRQGDSGPEIAALLDKSYCERPTPTPKGLERFLIDLKQGLSIGRVVWDFLIRNNLPVEARYSRQWGHIIAEHAQTSRSMVREKGAARGGIPDLKFGVDQFKAAWTRFRPAAHLWCAASDHVTKVNYSTDGFPCLGNDIWAFLARAEYWRSVAEVTSNGDGPLLRGDSVWRVPGDVSLPLFTPNYDVASYWPPSSVKR